MLRALALDGPDAVRRLRGMFAFASWDERARELLLARDPLGIKPLYVASAREVGGDEQRWTLVFASEVRAVLASGLIPAPKLDPEAVASMVWNGFVVGAITAVRGVRSLGPGEVRTVGGDGRARRSETHWSMPEAAAGG